MDHLPVGNSPLQLNNIWGNKKDITIDDLAKCQGKGQGFLAKSYNQIKLFFNKGVIVREQHVKEALRGVALDPDKMKSIQKEFHDAIGHSDKHSSNVVKVAHLFSRVNIPEYTKTEDTFQRIAGRTKIIDGALKKLDSLDPEIILKSLVLEGALQKNNPDYKPSGIGNDFKKFLEHSEGSPKSLTEKYADFKEHVKQEGLNAFEEGDFDLFSKYREYPRDKAIGSYMQKEALAYADLLPKDDIIFKVKAEKNDNLLPIIDQQELAQISRSEKLEALRNPEGIDQKLVLDLIRDPGTRPIMRQIFEGEGKIRDFQRCVAFLEYEKVAAKIVDKDRLLQNAGTQEQQKPLRQDLGALRSEARSRARDVLKATPGTGNFTSSELDKELNTLFKDVSAKDYPNLLDNPKAFFLTSANNLTETLKSTASITSNKVIDSYVNKGDFKGLAKFLDRTDNSKYKNYAEQKVDDYHHAKIDSLAKKGNVVALKERLHTENPRYVHYVQEKLLELVSQFESFKKMKDTLLKFHETNVTPQVFNDFILNAIKDDIALPLLQQICDKATVPEILNFIIAVEDFKQEKNPEKAHAKAQDIINTYVRHPSPQEINIDARTRVAIEKSTDFPKELFSEAETHLLKTLRMETFKRPENMEIIDDYGTKFPIQEESLEDEFLTFNDDKGITLNFKKKEDI